MLGHHPGQTWFVGGKPVMLSGPPRSGQVVPFADAMGPARSPVPDDEIARHIRSNRARGLPEVQFCPPAPGRLRLACGGPSLRDHLAALRSGDAPILCINGVHDYLIGEGIVPWGCLVVDPRANKARENITPDQRVSYFIASQSHPWMVDWLLKSGTDVFLWHALTGEKTLKKFDPGNYVTLVTGGSSAGLRALPLAGVLGWRNFDVYGLDGSYGPKGEHHPYPKPRDDRKACTTALVMGAGRLRPFYTRPDLARQAMEFVKHMNHFAACAEAGTVEPVNVRLYGDGLVQWYAAEQQRTGAAGSNYEVIR